MNRYRALALANLHARTDKLTAEEVTEAVRFAEALDLVLTDADLMARVVAAGPEESRRVVDAIVRAIVLEGASAEDAVEAARRVVSAKL